MARSTLAYHEEEAVWLDRLLKYKKGPSPTSTTRESVAVYADRWLTAREGRISSIRDDRARLRDHVLPLVGSLDVVAMSRDDVERVRDDLDRKVALPPSDPKHLWPRGS